MKKIATAAAAAITTLLPQTAAAAVTPQPLPEGVVEVYPMQGYIDTSNNQYPLGAGSISVEFKSVPEANPECTDLICIYVDGSAEPAETLVAGESAFADAMGYSFGGFNFSHAYAAPGTYLVTVPEGAWTVAGAPSPALTLCYEVRESQWLTPEPGITDEISTIILTVAGKVVTKSATAQPSLHSGVEDYDITVDIAPNAENANYTDIVLTPETAITKAGTYTLMIPGGCYSFTTADGEVITTQEVVATYTVPLFAQPECTPAEGSELESFSTFTIIYPEGYVPIVTDDMGSSYIYPVRADGRASEPYIYRLKEVKSDDKGVTIGILGPDNKYHDGEEYTPADGEYILKVSEGLFSGYYGEEFVNNPEYTYHFTIKSGTGAAEAVSATPGKVTIVRIDGTVVVRDADPAIIRTLPKGIYVVEGRLVYSLGL